MDKRELILKEEKVSSAITKMAIPAIVGMLVMAIYNVVDTLFVAQLGTQAIGAVSVMFPVFMLLSAIGSLFGMGGASYISRLLGKKDYLEANKTASTSFFTSLATGIIFAIFGIIFINQILYTFGATPTIMVQAKQYSIVLFAVAPIQVLNMALNNMLRGEGSAKQSMVGMLVGSVLNIILDPIFIFVFDLGIRGAALATALSQIIAFIILISVYWKKKSIVRIKLKYFTFKRQIYKEIFVIGMPAFFRQILTSVAMAVLNVAARGYGDYAIAGVGIITRVLMIGYLLFFGFAQGFQPVAGYSYGATDFRRLKDSLKFSVKFAVILSVIIGTIYIVFSARLVSLFTQDKAVFDIAIEGLRYSSYTLPLMAMSVIITMLFQSMGHGFGSLVLSMARQGIFLIPATIILPGLLQETGLILAQPIADVLTAFVTAAFATYIIRIINKKIDLNEQIPVDELTEEPSEA